MADTKISALAQALPGTLDPSDLLVIVDVQDVSMAASGTTKFITIATAGSTLGANGVSLLIAAGWALP